MKPYLMIRLNLTGKNKRQILGKIRERSKNEENEREILGTNKRMKKKRGDVYIVKLVMSIFT